MTSAALKNAIYIFNAKLDDIDWMQRRCADMVPNAARSVAAHEDACEQVLHALHRAACRVRSSAQQHRKAYDAYLDSADAECRHFDALCAYMRANTTGGALQVPGIDWSSMPPLYYTAVSAVLDISIGTVCTGDIHRISSEVFCQEFREATMVYLRFYDAAQCALHMPLTDCEVLQCVLRNTYEIPVSHRSCVMLLYVSRESESVRIRAYGREFELHWTNGPGKQEFETFATDETSSLIAGACAK